MTLPGWPRMVKFGCHSVKPELRLCRDSDLHRPEYEQKALTMFWLRSCAVAHWSIAVAAISPARLAGVQL